MQKIITWSESPLPKLWIRSLVLLVAFFFCFDVRAQILRVEASGNIQNIDTAFPIDPASLSVDKSASILVGEGTSLRFAARAAGTPRNRPTTVMLTVSQGGQILATYGPPGLAQTPKSLVRVAPDCRPKMPHGEECLVLPMFTVSQALGPVTVNATASYFRGYKLNIVVTYISVNGAKKGSSNADALPVATGNCGSGGPIITLLPSYHFDNSVLNLKKASFFFSATYLGPSPGDPPCIVPPGGVSGVIGPVDVLPSGAEIPGYEYIGKILASGRWFLIAYSPEVGKTVTCERSFGNNGIVVFRTWDPISVNGMCY